VIFANGDVTESERVRRALDGIHANTLLIAADGGARVAAAFGVTPNVVIGDMDSIAPDTLAALEQGGALVLRYPPEKDETDLELALLYAAAKGVSHITVIGATGDRLDQTLSAVYLLALPAFAGCDVRLLAGRQEARLMKPGNGLVDGAPGDTVSLIPLNGSAHGIHTEGLQYPLRGEDLVMGPARGISNVMTGAQARITFASGDLLIIHTQGRA
jgi:thiamine pyrophosphokinase